jgi:tRNA (mo5U34)-methyltransferase
MESRNYDVERIACSVYDLDPAEIGQFEFVYVGSLLLHLRDPVLALERVRSVCRGELVLAENVDPLMTMLFPRLPIAILEGQSRPWWWRLNLAALRRVLSSAGFDLIAPPQRVRFPRGRGRQVPPLRAATLRDPTLRRELYETLVGDPHAVLRARPRAGL